MAYINFDPNKNYFDIIRGQFNATGELREFDSAPDKTLLHEGKELIGVRIRNVFEKREIFEHLTYILRSKEIRKHISHLVFDSPFQPELSYRKRDITGPFTEVGKLSGCELEIWMLPGKLANPAPGPGKLP